VSDGTEALASSLAALAQFIVGQLTIDEALERVAAIAESAIPGAELTGVTLLSDDGPTTTACTHENAAEVDRYQYEFGDGPCLTAYRDRRVVRVDSMGEDKRWSEFSARAWQRGVRSSLSVPLVVDGRGLGALNFYGRDERAFSPTDEETAEVFAAHASFVLANAEAYWKSRRVSEQLEDALASRAVIEQAKGVIIEQSGVSADEAFDVLRRASQRQNRKLRDVAADIVVRAQARRGPSDRA
jgi:GAF domain-containing protein